MTHSTWILVTKAEESEELTIGWFILAEAWAEAELVHYFSARNRPWKLVKAVESCFSVTDGNQMHGIDSYPSRNSVFSKELMNHPSLSFLLSVENDDRLCSAADCLHEFTQCIKACEHNGFKVWNSWPCMEGIWQACLHMSLWHIFSRHKFTCFACLLHQWRHTKYWNCEVLVFGQYFLMEAPSIMFGNLTHCQRIIVHIVTYDYSIEDKVASA